MFAWHLGTKESRGGSLKDPCGSIPVSVTAHRLKNAAKSVQESLGVLTESAVALRLKESRQSHTRRVSLGIFQRNGSFSEQIIDQYL